MELGFNGWADKQSTMEGKITFWPVISRVGGADDKCWPVGVKPGHRNSKRVKLWQTLRLQRLRVWQGETKRVVLLHTSGCLACCLQSCHLRPRQSLAIHQTSQVSMSAPPEWSPIPVTPHYQGEIIVWWVSVITLWASCNLWSMYVLLHICLRSW